MYVCMYVNQQLYVQIPCSLGVCGIKEFRFWRADQVGSMKVLQGADRVNRDINIAIY